MKLITENGQLDLPKDFSLTMERTNPLMSDQGDATVPATLPSSSRNLAALEHRERIDRANPYTNKVDAILQVGPIQKRGQLIVDTIHRHDGIDATFAIDNSDLYAKAKLKTLRQIFEEYNNGAGYKIVFNNLVEAISLFQDIYTNGSGTSDFSIFPVAVAAYQEGEGDDATTVYQYNNEDSSGSLVYAERVVREGDVNMLVPEGYGIAPFLRLQKLLVRLFECLGYTVVSNCFDEAPYYSQIVIVHNCSDCLCNAETTLYYADLVPTCTLSEFLEWLLAKFHVQPVVNSESKEVRIVKMEAVLNPLTGTGGCDLDISDMVEGDFTVQLNPSRRVVLTPTLEIEGTQPAAETLDKLVEKYGFYVNCNETQFESLSGNSPAIFDCLIRRRSTGMFYLLERRLDTGKQEPHELGTNYFTYDRQNSDETEAYSQADVMPLMIIGAKRATAPFIGERINRHTSYKGKTDQSSQSIIAVQAHTSSNFIYVTTGTTQKEIPYANLNISYSFLFGLDNYSMHAQFWQLYNALLLNYPVHLSARLKLKMDTFFGTNMSSMKICKGQRLLPVKISARISEKLGLTDAEFILAKLATSGDAPIQSSAASELKWQRTADFDEAAFCQNLFDTLVQPYYTDFHPDHLAIYRGYRVEYEDFEGHNIWLGTPQVLGETRVFVSTGHYKINYLAPYYENGVFVEYRDAAEIPNDDTVNPEDFDHAVTVTFTAVAV